MSDNSLPDSSTGNRSEGRSSVELPVPEVKNEVASDEDEENDDRTPAELRRLLKEALKENEELQETSDGYLDQFADEARLRSIAEENYADEKKRTESLTKDFIREGEKYQALMQKFNDAITKSLQHGKAAVDAQAESAKLREDLAAYRTDMAGAEKVKKELAQAQLDNLHNSLKAAQVDKMREELEQLEKTKEELAAAKRAQKDTEDRLAEAGGIIAGLTDKQQLSVKITQRNPLTEAEIRAIHWKFPQVTAERDRMSKTIDELKVRIGRLEFERDNLKMDLARAPPPQASIDQLNNAQGELNELKGKYARLLETLAEDKKKAETALADSQRTIAHLRAQKENDAWKAEQVNIDSQRTIAYLRAELEKTEEKLRGVAGWKEQMERLREQLEKSQRTIVQLTEKNDAKDDRIKRMTAVQELEKRNPSFTEYTPPHSVRSDGHSERRERTTSGSESGRLSGGDRNGFESADSERRKYEERRERIRVLEEEKKRLEAQFQIDRKIIEELKRKCGHLENERNGMRTSLRQTKGHDISQDILMMQNEISILKSAAFRDEQVKEDLRTRLNRAEHFAKDGPAHLERIKELTERVDAMEVARKEKQAEFAGDRSRLEQELQSARDMANLLINTPQGELLKQVDEAKKRIQELERELQGQAGGSREKRARIEEEMEPTRVSTPSPPPFVLQGTAVIAPKMHPGKWKAAFGTSTPTPVPPPIPPPPPTFAESLKASNKRARFSYLKSPE